MIDIGSLPEGGGAFDRELFLRWRGILYGNLDFGISDSEFHSKPHCERVLLYALMISDGMEVDEGWKEALCHACIFHDTRRQDDWLDVGHGDRAAVYYEEYCRTCNLTFHPKAAIAMKFHDRDDDLGEEAIGDCADGLLMYRVLKDADALDRFRLGPDGLDERFLRTPQARRLVGFARDLVRSCMNRLVVDRRQGYQRTDVHGNPIRPIRRTATSNRRTATR